MAWIIPEETLTFEQFTRRPYEDMNEIRCYNNFKNFFFNSGSMHNERKRAQPFFKKFKEENPDLEERLTQLVTDFDHLPLLKFDFDKELSKIDPILYEAYLIFREYGVDNRTLFS